MKKRYLLIFLIVGFAIVFWFLFKNADAPEMNKGAQLSPDVLNPEQSPAEIEDLIVVESPLPNNNISSPLVVKGKARGEWYFEGSFPVELVDSSNNTLASAIATAQGDWMTSEYVPFTASLKYSLDGSSQSATSGFLLLKKENPSGDPARDQTLRIPINF